MSSLDTGRKNDIYYKYKKFIFKENRAYKFYLAGFVLGIISFILISSISPLNDNLLKLLYPKRSSLAFNLSNWKSYDQQVKDGKINAAAKIIEVELTYNNKSDPRLVIKEIKKKNGAIPQRRESENGYLIELRDNQNNLIQSVPFNTPEVLTVSLPLPWETPQQSAIPIDQSDLTVTVPNFENAVLLTIIDPSGNKIAESDLTKVTKIENPANFYSIRGDEFLKPQQSNIFDLDYIKNQLRTFDPNKTAYAANNALDIVFIGDKYSDMNALHSDINRFTQHLLSYEPFRSRASQVYFSLVDNTTDLGCVYVPPSSYRCNTSLVSQIVNSSRAEVDFIYVIVNNGAQGGGSVIPGNISQGYNGSYGPQVFVHELGHLIGGLHEEYVINEGQTGTINNSVYGNCYAGTPPAAAWENQVGGCDYAWGCNNFANWYSPSISSIMRSLDSPYFNNVSVNILNQKIDNIAGTSTDPCPGKHTLAGTCDLACCSNDSQCPIGQSCSISNGNCLGGFSCQPSDLGSPPPNCGCKYSENCTTDTGQLGTRLCWGTKNNLNECAWDQSGACNPTCSACTVDNSAPQVTPTSTPAPWGSCGGCKAEPCLSSGGSLEPWKCLTDPNGQCVFDSSCPQAPAGSGGSLSCWFAPTKVDLGVPTNLYVNQVPKWSEQTCYYDRIDMTISRLAPGESCASGRGTPVGNCALTGFNKESRIKSCAFTPTFSNGGAGTYCATGYYGGHGDNCPDNACCDGEQWASCTFEASLPPSNCSISLSSTGQRNTVNVDMSGYGGTKVEAFLQRQDGARVIGLNPQIAETAYNGKWYYKLAACNGSATSCSISPTKVTFPGSLGDYYFNCNVSGGPLAPCSGNPICDYENGPKTENCTAAGWKSCSDSDNKSPLSGRVTNANTGAGIDGININPGPACQYSQNLITATTANGGYFYVPNNALGFNFCMRPGSIIGFSGPDKTYECQYSGKYVIGLGACTGLDKYVDNAYNFTYTPLATPTPTPTESRVVFVSSTSYAGDLGGLSGADSKCQSLAQAVGLPGTFKSWLSGKTAATSAATRLEHAAVPYKLVNGTIVANNWTDLIDGTLLHAIDMDERGQNKGGFVVWTNTYYDGDYYMDMSAYTCSAFTNTLSTANGRTGHSGLADIRWTSYTNTKCNNLAPIYCVQQTLAVPTSTPTPSDTQPPTAPSNLRTAAVTSSKVDLVWSASTDNVGVDKYSVIRDNIYLGSTTTTSFTDTNVSSSRSYIYYIIATDIVGNNSLPSSTLLVNVPLPPDIQVPTIPANLAASAVSPSQINLSWTASTDNVGISGYEIYRNNVKIAVVASTTFGDTGLSAATTYSYFVKAFDAAGNISAASTTTYATTKTAATTGQIQGVVGSSSGGGVYRAKVTLTVSGVKRNAYTDSTGNYYLSNLPPGTYKVTFSANGYTNMTLSISVSAGVTTQQNVTLKKK